MHYFYYYYYYSYYSMPLGRQSMHAAAPEAGSRHLPTNASHWGDRAGSK